MLHTMIKALMFMSIINPSFGVILNFPEALTIGSQQFEAGKVEIHRDGNNFDMGGHQVSKKDLLDARLPVQQIESALDAEEGIISFVDHEWPNESSTTSKAWLRE